MWWNILLPASIGVALTRARYVGSVTSSFRIRVPFFALHCVLLMVSDTAAKAVTCGYWAELSAGVLDPLCAGCGKTWISEVSGASTLSSYLTIPCGGKIDGSPELNRAVVGAYMLDGGSTLYIASTGCPFFSAIRNIFARGG